MSLDPIRTRKFRAALESKSREELLELIKIQDANTYNEVLLIEEVFREKLQHLTWQDGTTIDGRNLTNKELALLIDEPFRPAKHLLEAGINAERQRELHLTSDPAMWCKTFLKDGDGDPIVMRAYQTLMLRHPSNRKVMRFGRRMGKTLSMTVLMLHRAITNSNYRVIVVAPQIKHVKIIYDEIVNMMDNNDYIGTQIKRNVASPSPEIDFINGSTIKFFTSGVKSGGRSDSTRGQEADLVILDELDYMHPDDLIAILAMLQDTRYGQQDKILVGASTPSGAHEVFYDWCNNHELFEEFFYPAYCNPMWSEQMEAEMRLMYKSANAYRHEIEADWGDNAEGVYPRRYLDKAFAIDNEWEYSDRREGYGDYFIGVDWDKYGAGTNIVVLQRLPKDYIDQSKAGKLRVVHREETPREEFTYSKAVQRVIELNYYFNPKFIYVDRGAGEMQVEMLHQHGLNDPFSGMGKKVKGISFKEVIEVRNPFTKQLERKETKPFMVDNLYRLLENELIEMPNSDYTLYHQLLSYIVLRISQTGQPIFDTINGEPDHAHDALLLAALAFTENYGDFFDYEYTVKAKAISNKFFMPLYVDSIGTKQNTEKVSSAKAYEPPEKDPDAKVKPITRSMPYNVRGASKQIKRRGF